MTDIRLEREYNVSPERLYSFVTQRENVLKWFGYEGMTFPADAMDFSALGPWFIEMISADGTEMKLSGQVTHVNPPKSVGFTWGWHDPEGNRGPESHVMYTIVETSSGARLIVDHRELGDDDVSSRHEQGWTRALRSIAEALEH